MADQKLTNKERLREITEGIEQGIKELFESDKYQQYLSTMSRFHRYSVNNTILIHMQKPDATLVAGFHRWKDQFERHVKKGEHGITIIAPTPFKKKIEEQKIDPDTKAPVLDKDGRVVTEEKEVEIPMFRPVKVFDASQTEGKPLPQLANNLSGDVQEYEAFMEALRRTAPVPMTVERISGDMDGYFSTSEQRIAIREGMSQVQTVSAAVHEIAHSKLHNYEKERQAVAAGSEGKEVKPKDRHTEEVEAESISYAVCQYYGIQTGENSFGYIASWSAGKELPELRASLETINKTASGLITDIDKHFAEICKERGIDRNAQQEQAEKEFVKETESAPILEPASVPEPEPGFSRYYITQETLDRGSYPFMMGAQVHETAELNSYEDGTVKAFGYLDYPHPLTTEQITASAFIPAVGNPILSETEQEQPLLTYYVAECMEFPSLGEYHENLSLVEAVRLYEAIPAERMNGIKGIGFNLQDGSDYDGEFPIVEGRHIDLETINQIAHFRDSPVVQEALADVMAALPDVEVLRPNYDEEMLFLVDGKSFLHIQTSEEGYDYTIYDTETKEDVDGGCLSNPDISLVEARREIFAIHGMAGKQIEPADLSVLEDLQEVQTETLEAAREPRRYAVDENGEVRRTFGGKLPENFTEEDVKDFLADTDALLSQSNQLEAESNPSPQPEDTKKSAMLPETPEQLLDKYPMPDEQVSTLDMQEYGYFYDGMLPVTRERALELDAAGLVVYVLHEDNTESMVFDAQEIMEHGGLFGVDHEEWEQSPQFHEKVMEREEYQKEREQAFLSHERNCFAIYQVVRDDPQNVRFMNLNWLQSRDIPIDRNNYELIYTAPLSESGTVPEQLDKLYQQFNLEKPVDYHSPSMSVSDIVAIKQNGKVSCHYCDSVGFTPVPGFLPENPLKNADMAVEDDYGMIDGIINNGAKEPTVAQLEQQARSGQPISLMALAEATHREEQDKKKSVVEQLKSQLKQEVKKSAPKKSAEREL